MYERSRVSVFFRIGPAHQSHREWLAAIDLARAPRQLVERDVFRARDVARGINIWMAKGCIEARTPSAS